jgi:hypothetical protein
LVKEKAMGEQPQLSTPDKSGAAIDQRGGQDIIGAALSPVTQSDRREDCAHQLIRSRAVEAAIWGMPIVATDAMRQAFSRDAGADYTDVVYWSKPADWKLQLTTPNGSTYYVATTINLARGPIVLDLPPAVGAGLFGSMNDAWQVPIADVGPAGQDAGKGGGYLITPPGYKGGAPAGYFHVPFNTINGYCLMRCIPEGTTSADIERALDLVRKIRLYPLAQAANPPASRHIDMAGKLYNGSVSRLQTSSIWTSAGQCSTPAVGCQRSSVPRRSI